MLIKRQTSSGEKYWELNRQRPGAVLATKNHQEDFTDPQNESDGKIVERPGSLRCPFRIVDKYPSHLNPNCSNLFQRPRTSSKKFNPAVDNIWFCDSPLGHNSLEQMIRKMTTQARERSFIFVPKPRAVVKPYRATLTRAPERMGGETSHCPSETCDARNPPKILRRKCQTVVSLAAVWHPLHCLFMDDEVDELGDRLEDLGIEIGVEFLYYAELCETFWRIKKLGSRKSCSSLVQAVAIAHLDLQLQVIK